MTNILYVRGVAESGGKTALRANDFTGSAALVASKRLYKSLLATVDSDKLPPLIPLVPLATSLDTIKDVLQQGDVTILASGDPLFYGIGRKLIELFPEQEIQFHPALSSLQLCFARFGMAWDDTEIVSLHGRDLPLLAVKLLRPEKVFVFTDPVNTPDRIAEQLLQECGIEACKKTTVHVAANLGSLSEHLFSGSIEETVKTSFQEPNVMILLTPKSSSSVIQPFGLQEDEITHSRGLITKGEVRAAVIHSLSLPESGVLWDVGAGSGSVGLECARFFPDLQVLAVERNEEQWQNIEANRHTYSAWNLQLIKGAAPEALQNLPDPDRIFIGGSGGNLEEILEYCSERLLPGGRIVVNAVIAKTAKLAPEILYRLSFQIEIKTVSVSRKNYPHGEKQQFNSIDIIVATKNKQE